MDYTTTTTLDIIDQMAAQCGVELPPEPFSLVDLATPTPPPTLWLSDPESWRLYAPDVYDPSAWFGRFDDPPVSTLDERIAELERKAK